MTFWDRLEAVQAAGDVLSHPFYVRWSAGELSRPELASYAGEYRHAVVALAEAAASAAREAEPELAAEFEAHAREEAAHIELWDQFARALGADLEREPLPETAACARTWAGDRELPLLERLVGMYTVEAAQPAISATKLEGLRAHYGMASPAATAYFDVHVERDVAHAAAGRALIERRLSGADLERLITRADRVLRANWLLLDGVDRRL